MPFCIPKPNVDKFLKALKDGTLDPAKLVKLDSEGRRAAFEPLMGKDAAEQANRLFEQKMLTKDIQRTMVTWAKTVAGIKPEVRQDLISRIERMDERILKPENEQKFLKDLASQKFGTEVTLNEVKQINKLTNKVKETRKALTDGQGDPANRRPDEIGAQATPEEAEYGRAAIDLETYVASLKIKAGDTSMLEKGKFLYSIPLRLKTIGHYAVIPFTHGRNSLYVPGEAGIFARTVGRAYSYGPGESALNRWKRDMASMRSDPEYDFWNKDGLDIKIGEKPEGLGSATATSRSFDALKQMRLDLAKKYWKSFSPEERSPEAKKNLINVINHTTGDLNVPASIAKGTKYLMFGPKVWFARHLSGLSDPFTSKFAAQRMGKIIAINVGLLAVNDLINRYILGNTGDDTVNWFHPTKADWLRMKVAGMTIPGAPAFEIARLPFRIGAVATDPDERNKSKVITTDLAGGLNPAITFGYDLGTGTDMWSGKALPFPGASQLLFGDKRNKVPDKQMDKYEYTAGVAAPMWLDPVLKNAAVNGVHMDQKTGASVAEALLTGVLGEHGYPTVPYAAPKNASIPKKVQSGQMDEDDARQEIQDKFNSGDMGKRAKKAQEKGITEDAEVAAVKSSHSTTENDFAHDEEMMKAAVDSDNAQEVEDAFRHKVLNVRKYDSRNAADRLQALIDKYF